jgi:hypothetical protein
MPVYAIRRQRIPSFGKFCYAPSAHRRWRLLPNPRSFVKCGSPDNTTCFVDRTSGKLAALAMKLPKQSSPNTESGLTLFAGKPAVSSMGASV